MSIFLVVVLLLSVVKSSMAADVSVVTNGTLQADVVGQLGQPTGKMGSGRRIIWMYPAGSVDFENGKVVRSYFPSHEEKLKEQALRAQQAEARRTAESEARSADPVKVAAPVAAAAPQQAALENISTRFVRPFVRPVFENVQYYNNIPVVFEMDKWPPAIKKKYDISVEVPVASGERRTTFDTLPYELKKYNDETLEQTLRCIYMIRDIHGSEAGRMSNPAGVAFYAEGIVLSHTCYLHHELAHQFDFLFSGLFPAKELTAVAGEYKGFGERKDLFYKEFWKLGYTSNYAMSDVHEDFAEFCSMLYLQPLALFQAMKENPKLQEKFDVIRPFIEMVKRRTTGDTAPMDEAYFAKFDRNVWKP